MKRYELVNWFIQQYGYRRYLEIGIDQPANCFYRVHCEHKVGVDPRVGQTGYDEARKVWHYRVTSDEFFATNREQFDIVFVDGLHLAEQALRDVEHALEVLSPEGTIVMHDCRPYNVLVAGPARVPGKSWYGTVWQAWATLRATRADLSCRVVLDDCGLGVVRRGAQKLYAGPYATFEDWARHQDEILQGLTPGQVSAIYARGAA